MYYQSYEDYMRQILGYPINDPNIYETYNYRNEDTYGVSQVHYNLTEAEINKLYPESYNLIYPLVCRMCDTNVEPISAVTIDKMTDEIYNIVEKNQTVINVKIGIENREAERKENTSKRTPVKFESRENVVSRNSSCKTENRENTINRFSSKSDNKDNLVNKTENRSITKETRQQNNPLLRDLIKILILQRLFGNGVIKPPRPNPPRPPYPPIRPPFPGGRPPVGTGMNRMDIDYTEYL